jgi:TatA/E family protein of Tat protein translocase
MFGLGIQEIAIIAMLVLVLFGPSRLPELAKSFGKSITEFKKAMKGESHESDQQNKVA